ncbi:MAG: thioesterase family protein [Thermaerobacter sp.]|nr:thioesterase family protein [Thermaerobacter sp.]
MADRQALPELAFPSRWSSSVRWAECDAAGIIYHGSVFDWFSEARATWLREHNLDYYQILRPAGIELLVREATASFHQALRPGDPVQLIIGMESVTAARAIFQYYVASADHAGQLAVTGKTSHAFVVSGRACRLDRQFPEIFGQFAANSPPPKNQREWTGAGLSKQDMEENG